MNHEKANDDALQFEKAEFEGDDNRGQSLCFVCSAPLLETYYDINGSTACERCKIGIERSMQGGSGLARIFKAGSFGIVAAIVGALIYFAIRKITGYEVGLVSILVGYLVGKAVFFGAGHRGGWSYQLLAVVLTYLAIVSTYLPFVFEEIGRYEGAQAAVEQSGSASVDSFNRDVPLLSAASQDSAPDFPETEIDDEFSTAEGSIEGIGWVESALALLLLTGLIVAMPFLAGMDNIIGLLIIGFGLYQAWSLNRKTVLLINGPFQIKVENAEPSDPLP